MPFIKKSFNFIARETIKRKQGTKEILFSIITVILNAGLTQARGKVEIKLDKITHNSGTLSENDPIVNCTFKFTNIGDGPLVIHQAAASCGCTVPEHTQEPIVLGGAGTIKVTYNGTDKYPGHFKKSITPCTNAKTGMIRLFVEGDMTTKDTK